MPSRGSKPKQIVGPEASSAPGWIPGPEIADDASVRGLQRTLEEGLLRPREFGPDVVNPVTAGDAVSEDVAPARSNFRGRLIKALLGLAVVAIFGWIPLRTLLQASSVEAIVNSRVI